MELGKVVKTFKSKKGREVVVRYPRWEDLESMHRYINVLAQEDTFLTILNKDKEITLREEKKFLKKTSAEIKKGDKRHFAVLVDGIYAGNCEIERRPEHRVRHVGVLAISLAAPYREEGIGSELVRLLIDEGRDMGLRLLELTCFANNTRALHVYEKLGFKKVGVTPRAIAYQGGYVGEVKLYLPLVATK